MGPRKRKSAAEEVTEAKKESTVIGRVTRSALRLASKESVTEPKKEKAAAKEKAVKKAKITKTKEQVKEVKEEVEDEEDEVAEAKNVEMAKTIVIEHW